MTALDFFRVVLRDHMVQVPNPKTPENPEASFGHDGRSDRPVETLDRLEVSS